MKRQWSSFITFLWVPVALGLAAFAPSLAAPHYPDHPIQLVVPNPAGSIADINARMLAQELERILAIKIILNNKPGASSVLGTDAVVRGKKDGYALLYVGSSALIYAPNANPEAVHYDPAKDLEPLGLHCFVPTVVGVKAEAPWKTFPEFVDYAKKNPGKIRIASMGMGFSTHFQIEMLQSITGIKLTHVPFEGGESTMTALLGGHVEASVDGFSKQKPHAEAGRIRLLLIDIKKPSNAEIPTLSELGYKRVMPSTWFAIFAPSGIPEEVRRVLIPAIEKAVRITTPKIDQMGSICEYRSPGELGKLMDEESKQVYRIAVEIGLRKP